MQHIASDTSKNRIKRSKYASNYEYRVREAVPIISFIKRMEDIAMIYDFAVTTGKGAQLNLSDYKGKVILVVNTATGCGFTPQYAPIEQLYKDYHNQGLEILDIPCNQFGGQAPGTDDEIHEFCTLHFNTTFPQMKIRIGTRSRTSSGTLQSSLSIVTARWSQDSSRRRIWLKWRLA